MALSAADILRIWEDGPGGGTTRTVLRLLAASEAEAGWEDLCALPLGERDRRLLALRAATLGRRIEVRSHCPECGEAVGAILDCERLSATTPPAAGPWELARGDLRLRLRLPDSRDLMAVESAPSVEAAARRLAERCVLEGRRNGEPLAEGDLSDQEVEAVGEWVAATDPGAETLVALDCPECGRRWRELFDVATFLRDEIDLLARRLLREVAVLARSYGWREADVLAMTARRRRAYLELLA